MGKIGRTIDEVTGQKVARITGGFFKNVIKIFIKNAKMYKKEKKMVPEK